MQWPGYPEYRKQVELQNVNHAPITMSKLAERIARFVERFIEVQEIFIVISILWQEIHAPFQNAANRPINGPWRVGSGGYY